MPFNITIDHARRESSDYSWGPNYSDELSPSDAISRARTRQRRWKKAQGSSRSYNSYGSRHRSYISDQPQPYSDPNISHPFYPPYAQPTPGPYPDVRSTSGYAPYTQPAQAYAPYVPPYVQYLPGHPPYAQPIPRFPTNAQYKSSSTITPTDEATASLDPNGNQPSFTREQHIGQGDMKRQGTADWEPRKPTRRVRYTIPLRSYKKVLEDEENALYRSEAFPFEEYGRQRQNMKENLKRKDLDIVSSHCIPNQDGPEAVSLIVIDQMTARKQEHVRCESRWRHISSEIMTFGHLYEQATGINGIGDDDMAVVARLLSKVQKTCEKTYIHGRYLKPISIVYEGKDSSEPYKKSRKTATFLSLPFFWLDHLQERKPKTAYAGHPSRALLQSRYRLESTERRDKEQVIAQSRKNKDRVVHVPQIWALIINQDTILTCAPFDESVLCGNSIKTVSYTDAQLDKATWSIHFKDTHGKTFYLPLRLCKTWFGLVRHISSDCLDDKDKRIQDQLLNAGPLFKLLSQDGSNINAESWPRIVEAYKAQVIHLTLVSEEIQSDVQGHASDLQPESNLSWDSSDPEDDELVDPLGPRVATANENGKHVPAIAQPHQLQIRLHQAIIQAGGVKRYELMQMHMPVLEALIYELTPNNHTARPPGVPGLEGVIFLRDPSTAISNVKDNALRPRARNRGEDDMLTLDTYSVPTSEADGAQGEATGKRTAPRYLSPRGVPKQETDHRSQRNTNTVGPSSKPESVDGYADWPPVPYPYSAPAITNPVGGHTSIHPSPPGYIPQPAPVAGSSPPDGAATYSLAHRYAPYHQANGTSSAGQLVPFGSPAFNESMMQSVLNGEVKNPLRDPESSNGKSPSIYYQPLDGKLDISRQDLPASFSHKTEPQYQGASALPVALEIVPRRVRFQERPRVKKLLKLARKEVHRALNTRRPTTKIQVTFPVEDLQRGHLPIFLWSIKNPITSTPKQSPPGLITPIIEEQEASGLDGDGERQSRSPHRSEELILHIILNEAHARLGKALAGSRVNPENAIRMARDIAVMYEVIEPKTASQVSLLLDYSCTKEQNASEADIREVQGQTGLGEAGKLAVKRIIYDIAEKCLNAFVPKECDAAVVAKYWGSIYRLLTEKDETALHSFSLRLKELWLIIRDIHMGVEPNDGSKQVHFHIPSALPAAFQQLIMFSVISSCASSEAAMKMKFEDCKALLTKGRTQLIQMIHTPDFRGRVGFETVDPEALLALIISNLISKMSTEDESDLTEIYGDYTLKLQRMVRDRASVKVYDEIKLLQEEVEIIKSVLAQQDSVLQDFKSIVCDDHHSASLGVALIDRSLESIERRFEDFDELQEQANTARFLAAQSISLKAENNNKAILVFTVTTIIFLPLSFVTSYLGMNTSDLRNMGSGQTLFWTVGAPLAFLILGLALMAAYFGSLRQRALRWIKRLKKKYD